MSLIQSYPAVSIASMHSRDKIAAAQKSAAAARRREEPREPPLSEIYQAGFEREARQEAAARRAKIRRAVARYNEGTLAAMRAESAIYLARVRATLKPGPKPKPAMKARPRSMGSRRVETR